MVESSVPVVVPGGTGGVDDDLLDGLNPPQREAVTYRGPALLIVAGAGSGKTRVLTHRIASLLRRREAWPSQILAITFTNKAAGEMRERVGQLVGESARGMWISTFHSACVRILRREAENFGFTSSFTIYDSGDSRALIKRLVKDREAERFGLSPAGVQGRISRLKNELTDAAAFARQANFSDPAERLFSELFGDYERALQRANAFDFDDLIAQTVYLFRAFPAVADAYRKRFRHILVDEYQDTNAAQYALIHELTRPVVGAAEAYSSGGMMIFEPEHAPELEGASLTVVGDSDQSIYAFRGADIRNISEFERDFPGARVVLLEQNYRSTQNILSAANAVIGHNFDRKAKNLWTDSGAGERIVGYTGYSQHDEAQFVADEIEAIHRRGVDYSQVAVFYRTNAQSRALEEILIRAAVPYKIMGGTKFYERAEIKDALAYLTAVANPADEMALRRIVNKPKRGIGDVSIETISRFAADRGITFREALGHAGDLGVGPKLQTAITHLHGVLGAASEIMLPASGEVAPPTAVADGLSLLLGRSGYLDALRMSRDPQDEARVENLDEFVAVAREFARNNPDGTVIDFLAEVALVSDADDLDDASGSVSLMTLHTAKGLEYDAVFITGVEEDLLPHRISAGEPGGPAEERRLFYVGVTRARKRLYLSLAMTRAQFGEIASAVPSRFLQEIPADLVDWRQSPADLVRQAPPRFGGGSGSRGGFRNETPALLPKSTSLDRFANKVPAKVRDNGDMELAAGDRIRHDDFGEGRVDAVTGEGAKRIAHVRFDSGAAKRLLVKIAPIEKI
ncbi:MAG: UvrD-helicase domain-containing protein [Microbacterium ginsengisoli]|jgi:DNA helicase-2/ATP-dependent DNA helicase PcrA|uniref:ATP-dependent helicase n=1 Tax=Microbacterium TaxID=33882 RepID=UPI0006F2A9A5|nr:MULTISPECIES: UvrD-helicase domain-containing protein [unclassified Microbacterium]KQS02638.1 ATP-dependent DNA helicase PcrA [Microbacterium sp. Leaf347]KQS05976.1 ATP-dependent DNA helicase PcrA [Microbacterium sp. Leaf351]MBN9198772.1 UvrD-helicase domain-containing protein [Microbacterium ginsengisoli]OJU75554.1 MAG: ATP-dependent DNA helicase PcrA [Microbacterium sp. 71-23]